MPTPLAAQSMRIQLANTFAALVGAFYLRSAPRSSTILGVLDVVATLTSCSVWALMILLDEGAGVIGCLKIASELVAGRAVA